MVLKIRVLYFPQISNRILIEKHAGAELCQAQNQPGLFKIQTVFNCYLPKPHSKIRVASYCKIPSFEIVLQFVQRVFCLDTYVIIDDLRLILQKKSF